MIEVLAGLAVLAVCGVAALALRSQPRITATLAIFAPACAWALAVPPIARVLAGGPELTLEIGWMAPLGPLLLGLDALSAFFLLVVLTLSALAAVYGVGYLHGSPRDGASWFFFHALVASMALVVLARHVLLFLLAWETMALASFFLVAHEREQQSVRRASWVYLIATHLASLFLLPMFFLLVPRSGSLAFADLGQGPGAVAASLCFVLGLVGFGCKAGLVPLHVWLPEAHPAAPSHVSALLSGAMVKLGIYGLLRLLTLLGEPMLWWGWLLLLLGTVSALLGVLLSLAQHDLKRLLAYSTVENVGIVACGMGAGVCGNALGSPTLAVLGFAGALFHVGNHALFKGLAFFGAGSVLHAAGTVEMDTLGGLRRRMPWTAGTFLVASAALCGLPPLNGFASELVIYLAMLWGAIRLSAVAAVPLALGVIALATVGALALAGAAKVYGIVFLGEPRGPAAEQAHESSRFMLAPMLALAGLCLAVGAASGWIVPALARIAAPLLSGTEPKAVSLAAEVLKTAAGVSLAVAALAVALALVRHALLRRRDVRLRPTWDCGYVAVAPTMQYTASSFTQPTVDLFASLLGTRKRVSSPEIHFPDAAHVATETPDLSRQGIYEPVFQTVSGALRRILILQHGRLHVYVLGIVLTLLLLLLWQVG